MPLKLYCPLKLQVYCFKHVTSSYLVWKQDYFIHSFNFYSNSLKLLSSLLKAFKPKHYKISMETWNFTVIKDTIMDYTSNGTKLCVALSPSNLSHQKVEMFCEEVKWSDIHRFNFLVNHIKRIWLLSCNNWQITLKSSLQEHHNWSIQHP